MSEADRRARRGNRPTTTWALTATLALMAVAPLQAQAPERGAFVVMRGADTLAVERFQRTATSLESTLTERIQGMRIGTTDAVVHDVPLAGENRLVHSPAKLAQALSGLLA